MQRFVLGLTLVLACTTSKADDDGSAGSGGDAATTTAAATTTTGGSGGMPGTGGAGGGGGGSDTCPDIFIDDGMPAMCSNMPGGSLPLADTTICPSDSGVFWPAMVYEVAVAEGDCIFMQADNVGSPLGADLFGATVDPNGKSILWDEEQPCSVSNPDGYACPAGGATIEAQGTAYVMVGTWEGAGCMPEEATPFELTVAVNGVDVDLSSAAVCAGDLLEIIP